MQEDKKWVIISLFLITGFVFLVRLFFIQVLSKEYEKAATNNARQRQIVHPHRGIIYDRKGELLVFNAPVYDLMVIPAKVNLKDTLAFCNFLGITQEQFDKSMRLANKYHKSKPSPFLKQVSQEDFAKIQDKLIDYPGFYAVSRTIRSYPSQSLAHVLGYIGEISDTKLKADKSGYYSLGDYVGISGLEAAYEKELRGKKGVKHIWVDAKGREKGSFNEGEYDTISVAGKNLHTGIDLKLQQYAEWLMQNKAGSIVAIEPSSGEIIAMVSAPSYNPNLLTGRLFSKNYGPLAMDEHKPLFNRAISAKYPPGSTFKTVQALTALQENVINAQTVFPCNKSLVNCHWHPIGGVHNSIQHSCNPYYFMVFRRIIYQNKIIEKDSIVTVSKDGDGITGFGKWREYMLRFGLGRKTGVDLSNELAGNIPEISLYNDRYGYGQWKFSNVYSLGIGQGEVGVLPLQLANLAAIIANRGYYYTPHVVKAIGKDKNKKIRDEFKIKHETDVKREHFELIIAGMRDAYRAGTVVAQFTIPDIEICSKTGTAQNPHGKDHSVFMAFAPRENPKIAIAVYVENAGFGGEWAAPIASLIIEKYLKGEISKKWLEEMVVKKSFIFKKEIPEKEEEPEKDNTNNALKVVSFTESQNKKKTITNID